MPMPEVAAAVVTEAAMEWAAMSAAADTADVERCGFTPRVADIAMRECVTAGWLIVEPASGAGMPRACIAATIASGTPSETR